MGFFTKEKEQSPAYSDDLPVTSGYSPDEPAQCPPHTTERKLLLRIDLHVMPFLCIMYRMYEIYVPAVEHLD